MVLSNGQKWMHRKIHMNMTKQFSVVQLSTGTGCPEMGSPSQWRYSKSICTQSCAVFSRMVLLEEGGGAR